MHKEEVRCFACEARDALYKLRAILQFKELPKLTELAKTLANLPSRSAAAGFPQRNCSCASVSGSKYCKGKPAIKFVHGKAARELVCENL